MGGAMGPGNGPMADRMLRVHAMGRQAYGDVLTLQRGLCRARLDGRLADDVLLLVEHPPVVTLGRGTKPESLPLSPAELARHGLDVYEVERGGDVTYHGPGQLVGYPILDLQTHRPDLHWYLRQLEEVLIAALGQFGLAGERNAGYTGVWIDNRKIASIGVHVKQWVTFHGFALNVTTALDAFDVIVPCGIPGVAMTSIAREAERTGVRSRQPGVLWQEAEAAVVAAMGAVFDRLPTSSEDLALAELAEPERPR